jgi:hypothetical protein
MTTPSRLGGTGAIGVLATAFAASCGGSSFGTQAPQDAGGNADGTMSTDAAPDGTADVSPGLDGLAETGTGDAAPATYSDVTDPGKWQAVPIPATVDAGLNAPSYWGAAFDGRNLYYAPNEAYSGNYSGLVSRYDTTASFLDATAWSSFDTSTVNANAVGFAGAEFDGRYVYYVPLVVDHSGGWSGLVVRCDTQAAFASGPSYDLFDTTSVNPNAKGFAGGAFDGRYVYLAPYLNPNAGTIATRFDTTASFESGASWETFDVSGVDASAGGYLGAVFDGRYVYYAPYGTSANSGVVSRFDTTTPFTSASSWAAFDLTTVHSLARGYSGAVFDGRYVYFVPYQYSASGTYTLSGRVARLDTQGSFGDASAWSTFDLTTVNPKAAGFWGGVFDGRYVYVVPNNGGGANGSTITARYDTTAPFASASSWTAMDLSTVSDEVYGFYGGAFDGEYVYFVPADGVGVALRFDAKTPPSMPPSYKGSFY